MNLRFTGLVDATVVGDEIECSVATLSDLAIIVQGSDYGQPWRAFEVLVNSEASGVGDSDHARLYWPTLSPQVTQVDWQEGSSGSIETTGQPPDAIVSLQIETTFVLMSGGPPQTLGVMGTLDCS